MASGHAEQHPACELRNERWLLLPPSRARKAQHPGQQLTAGPAPGATPSMAPRHPRQQLCRQPCIETERNDAGGRPPDFERWAAAVSSGGAGQWGPPARRGAESKLPNPIPSRSKGCAGAWGARKGGASADPRPGRNHCRFAPVTMSLRLPRVLEAAGGGGTKCRQAGGTGQRFVTLSSCDDIDLSLQTGVRRRERTIPGLHGTPRQLDHLPLEMARIPRAGGLPRTTEGAIARCSR